MVPTVNDVKLTGDDGENPWPRVPNQTGGYQLDARFADLQEQALGALRRTPRFKNMPPQRLLDDLASFQRVLFTNDRVRALSDAISSGALPLPDPDPPLDELETQGKAVFERACSVCHGGPRQSTTPFSDRSIPRHPDAVSAATAESTVRLQAMPERGWPGMPGPYEIELSIPPLPPEVVPTRRSGGRAPIRAAPLLRGLSAVRTAVR